METGLLNFHDEETFATSLYDQGDFSGADGQGSLLDLMQGDLQYSSDYLNQSAVHWDSDQEQEHNGDLAVLPVAPSECSSLNSSKEDYHKSLFEWQDSLLTYQPLDPDGVDLRLDGRVVPTELPDNIFEDSFETHSTSSDSSLKPSVSDLVTSARCSTPKPCSASSSDGSLNLDVSLSGLDVNVSDIDVSALGMNVSSLEIKSEAGDFAEEKSVGPLGSSDVPCDVNISSKTVETEQKTQPSLLVKENSPTNQADDLEFAALFGDPSRSSTFGESVVSKSLSLPIQDLDNPLLPIVKVENSDVEQLHDLAMEFIKEEEEAQAWDSLPLIDAPLDCNMDLDSIGAEVPVLEAGNLESLLEQFEATVKPASEFTQSMPASPAHFSVPPSPLSMPASPSSIAVSHPVLSHASKSQNSTVSSFTSPTPSPSKPISGASTPQKSPSRKKVSVLHQNILDSLPVEFMDRIKASGQKKTIPLIPAMPAVPSKRPSRSLTRMQAAGATLSRNKLLKLVSRKSNGGENVQFDHDYCSNDPSNIEFIPQKLVNDIKASAKLMECEEEKSSRKDSGLESGDVSEDSEGPVAPLRTNPGCDSGGGGSRSNYSILKPRISNNTGRNKEMLMVSVLKKVRNDPAKSPLKQQSLLCHKPVRQLEEPSRPGDSKPVPVKVTLAETSNCNALAKTIKSVQVAKDQFKVSVKPVISSNKSNSTPSMCSDLKTVTNTVDRPSCQIDPTGTKFEAAAVKSEPPEIPTSNFDSSELHQPKLDTAVKSAEPPKKRKLNLEEYRSRQKANEQKREVKSVTEAPLLIQKSSDSLLVSKPVEAVQTSPQIKKEANTEPTYDACDTKSADDFKEESGEKLTVNTVLETDKPPEIIRNKIIDDVDRTVVSSHINEVKESKPEEKRKHRQYRIRRVSTSSSEESSHAQDLMACVQREAVPKKATWPPARSKSRSLSASSSKSRSSSSDSSSSSESDDSVKTSQRTRARGRRRARRRRSSSSLSGRSGRSSSRSSRRSNSISSGSSRRSSRRASRRSRSRSRSRRRSYRDRGRCLSRSRSSSRGRGGSWRRARRDSTRSRRLMSQCRSSAGRFQHSRRSRSQSRSKSRSRTWSRRSSSYSSGKDRRRFRSRSKSPDRKRARMETQRKGMRTRRKLWRSRSPIRKNVEWSRMEKERNRQIEERRVVYVGRIPEDTTKAELRRRFEVFGPIIDISLHFREHADNYGFVTFAYKVDAYEAVERGNDDPSQPHYELCFGGRRKFCRERYADLDGMACKSGLVSLPPMNRGSEGDSFDDMLREVQAKLQARKKL